MYTKGNETCTSKNQQYTFFFFFCLFLPTNNNSWYDSLPVLDDGGNRDPQCWHCCCCGSDDPKVDKGQVRTVWEGSMAHVVVDASSGLDGQMGVDDSNLHRDREGIDRMGEHVVTRWDTLDKPGFLKTCEANGCILHPCGSPSYLKEYRQDNLCSLAPWLPVPDLASPSVRSCMTKD